MQAKDVKILANLLSKKPRAKRATPAQKRRDITNAKIEALENAPPENISNNANKPPLV